MASGSAALDAIVARLRDCSDPRRRYEYVLWLGKKLPPAPDDLLQEANRVRGCASSVYVAPTLEDGVLHWQGQSDALITRGLLALLIQGLDGLTPEVERDFAAALTALDLAGARHLHLMYS